ncbi:MAG: transcriptional regulator NrdR [Acutalibacteraceae bacterium]
MKCPFCSYTESKVIDSRPTDEGTRIRRRRECLECKGRFTTYEVIESFPIIVVKKDNTRQQFSRSKVLGGMLKASEGCEVSAEMLEKAVDNIEAVLQNSLDREVTSQYIGELVMEQLKGIDDVAYVRYASVYRKFKDINSFMEELSRILNDKNKAEQ